MLNGKVRNPSTPISLNSLVQINKEIFELINDLNKKIRANNETVENIDQEKELLKSQIWRFIFEKLKTDIDLFSKEMEKHSKAIKGMNSSLVEKKVKQEELVDSISELESKIISVQHSVNEINHLLKSFGFTNFELKKANKIGFYELVRDDGSKVEKTLSEGEYTFVTFLYFYHLLQGSIDQTRITRNKIVVIDDPISSLDSSVLFVVSNLIKKITKDAREKRNGIKQVFVLTHNVYFFKEVTFKGNRSNKWKEEAFWLVRKFKNQSRIVEHEENPIKTTYELLWRELDDPWKINTATIFNTMRRILEYYFNILGGLDYEDAISKFEGEEKVIFKSLLGWVNDGSHFINDDLAVTVDHDDIQKYLSVFKEIFKRMGHESHYKMMMKEESVSYQ
jgi:wobble nucleotide-excising tRNase